MLATLRSIEEFRDCGGVAEDRAGVLGATASLLEAALAGAGYAGTPNRMKLEPVVECVETKAGKCKKTRG